MPTTAEWVPVDLTTLSDHDLLAGGLDVEVAINRLAAERLVRMIEFQRRREADYLARKAEDPRFTLTPLQETVFEVGELWGLDEARVLRESRTGRILDEHLPGVWQLCRTGALDLYRASLVADAAKGHLDRPVELARFAEKMTAWLTKGIPDDPERPRLVNRTIKQLRNKINYEIKKLKPRDADERFRRAFKEREVHALLAEDGMGTLSVSHTVTDIQLADYRLTLAAKALRAQGDERTIAQLRSDLALDLLIGRATVDASIAQLEDEETPNPGDEGVPGEPGLVRELPTSNYARPVINVTVPIQTLMGFSDHPGVLSGGTVIPAGLARMIAQDEGSTWFRMLTDEHGQMVELSTKSYQPTTTIWRDLVARYSTCYRRNCSRAATECECDHLEAWPQGATSTTNLGPGCRRDHVAKHGRGCGVKKNPDGTLTFHTRAGFNHTTEHTEHPATDHWPDVELLETQHTATEILDAIRFLNAQQKVIDASISNELDEDERWLLDLAS